MARIDHPSSAAIPPLLKDLNERTVLEASATHYVKNAQRYKQHLTAES